MEFTLKNTAITSLLLLAVSLSSWSILTSLSSQTHTTPINPHEADAFMENVKTTILDKNGKPTLELSTPKMTHYPHEDTTHIIKPHITLYRDSTKPWFIDAKEAKATHGIQEILFWNEVNIHHSADENHPTTTLQTDYLTIFPDRQTASTNEPVTFIQPDTTIHAVGMLANLEAGTIQLLSRAKGEYAPSP